MYICIYIYLCTYIFRYISIYKNIYFEDVVNRRLKTYKTKSKPLYIMIFDLYKYVHVNRCICTSQDVVNRGFRT
jgi:hypothetical protein